MAKIHTPIPALKLNDGQSMPMLALGTGTAWYKRSDSAPEDKALIDSLKMAIGMDYRHLDGAQMYNTEPELGRAIAEGGVPREELFITTKVRDGSIDIKAALQESLKKLKLSYVDLYLIHAPFFSESEPGNAATLDKVKLQTAWRAMEECRNEGLTKSIGVSNYQSDHIIATLETATVPIACNQIEFHPYLQQPELLATHKKHGIATVAYAPLTPVTKASGGPIDDFLAALAKKYAVHEAEVLLRWCVDQDVVPVTTSSKEQRLSDYLRMARFKLTPKEIEELCELGKSKVHRGFWTKQLSHLDKAADKAS